ncbi:ROK family protein [Halomicroarcula limicola]|uniref:ROK family protein n=1 Tax=Haloarcula limicola TaxID=1429915 RepID=A0A8J7Y2D5_9EURY|nr:ROK family protein [Halomicroarcula limicola]MBV0923030.1 ROK family protein [Halomicroarcula limicola]
MGTYAGVDLGATHIRAIIGDESGTPISSYKTETPRGPNGIAVTEAVLDALREACAAADIEPTDVVAAGIGSFGPLDLAEGIVENPANLPDTIDRIPLTGPVENLLGTSKVYLHNDANAGAIGERFYADRNPDDMIYLTISSGVGAGVVVDGNVLSGWDGNAGEVGHLTIDPHGFMTCGCGHDGHWEAYCSGENIPRYATRLHREDPVETALPLDTEGFSAADVFEYAGEDDFASHVLEQVCHWNAIGVANMVHSYAPLVIYVGGAVAMNNPEQVLDPIRNRLDDMVMSNIPDIQLTNLGDDVGVRGALASALTAGTGDPAKGV